MKLKLPTTISALTVLATSVIANMSSVNAAALVGKLDITGAVSFTQNSLDWLLEPGAQAGPDPGTFRVESTSTGSFKSFSIGLIKDLKRATDVFPLSNFLDLGQINGRDTFTVESISPTTFADTLNGGSTASISVTGFFKDGADITRGTGIFTAQFADLTAAQVQKINTPTSTSYSASFRAVPEPSETAGLVSLSAAGVMFVVRNRKRFT